jgi:hypothetical protein
MRPAALADSERRPSGHRASEAARLPALVDAPVGRFRAAFFLTLGYSAAAWARLEVDLRSQYLPCDAVRKPDERVAEAIGLVVERRQPDGRWLLDEPHRDAIHDDLEGGAGQPSRWNTLRALRVLDWYSAQS